MSVSQDPDEKVYQQSGLPASGTAACWIGPLAGDIGTWESKELSSTSTLLLTHLGLQHDFSFAEFQCPHL